MSAIAVGIVDLAATILPLAQQVERDAISAEEAHAGVTAAWTSYQATVQDLDGQLAQNDAAADAAAAALPDGPAHP